jgi:hypothetical protein
MNRTRDIVRDPVSRCHRPDVPGPAGISQNVDGQPQRKPRNDERVDGMQRGSPGRNVGQERQEGLDSEDREEDQRKALNAKSRSGQAGQQHHDWREPAIEIRELAVEGDPWLDSEDAQSDQEELDHDTADEQPGGCSE